MKYCYRGVHYDRSPDDPRSPQPPRVTTGKYRGVSWLKRSFPSLQRWTRRFWGKYRGVAVGTPPDIFREHLEHCYRLH